MDEYEKQLEALKILMSKVSQEGDGLWSRFNYLVSVQLAILGAFILAYQKIHLEDTFPSLLLGIALFGLTMCILTFRTLARISAWHEYWANRCKDVAENITNQFQMPSTFPSEDVCLRPTKFLTGPLPVIGVFIILWLISLAWIFWAWMSPLSST